MSSISAVMVAVTEEALGIPWCLLCVKQAVSHLTGKKIRPVLPLRQHAALTESTGPQECNAVLFQLLQSDAKISFGHC